MTRQSSDKYLTAEEARQWGVINRVVPEGQLMAAAMEMAEEIMKMPPLSIKAIKQAVNRGMEGYEYSQQVMANLRATEDAEEGAKAFMEKREPKFRGK